MPGVSTRSCLTAGEVVASLVAIAAVPMSTPSTGMAVSPCEGRPGAGEVVDRAVRRTDAAADADDEVLDRAQVGVGREQELVEVLPRVVTAGDAALDVRDDGGVDLAGDREHLADLLHGAGLEHDVADAGVVQVLDDVDGVLELGDAGADHQAVEAGHPARRAFCTRRWPPTCSFHR